MGDRIRDKSWLLVSLRSIVSATCLATLLALLSGAARAEGEADAQAEDVAAPLLTAEELRIIVAPIAFYPDEVLALVLPASTTGIEIVQAGRFLEARATDDTLQPDQDWDPAILGLINYPDVIALLNADLDWTDKLATAVLDQLADVMDMIQQVRSEAVAAGYLKSDEHQTVTQNQETVVINSADPEVIYVPTYDPVVVVQQSYSTYPPYAYYPPYPYYYSPAATFFVGAAVGAAFAYGFDWNDNDIDIDVGDVNIGNIDADRFNGERVRDEDRERITWKGEGEREKRDRSASSRRDQAAGLAPANARGSGQAGAGGQRDRERVGDRAVSGRSESAFGETGNGRDVSRESKRGNERLNESSGKRQQSRESVSGRDRRGSHSAFSGGVSNGKQVSRQKQRGQRSMRSSGGSRRRR